MNVFDLLDKYGSPLYVYDEAILKNRCQQMKEFSNQLEKGLPNNISVQMHYSQKANSNLEILSIVKDSGLSVDCMSPYELMQAKKLFNYSDNYSDSDKLLYVCNNISSHEMKTVHENGVLICLDSISQVETWGMLFPNTEIMVRINPGTSGVGHSKKVVTSGKETKFGISEANIPELFSVASKYNLHIKGVHWHLGSLFLDDKINNYIEGVKSGLEIVKKYFSGVEIVDLGGGFGVPYKPDEKPLTLSIVVQELLPILQNVVQDFKSIKSFKFEPGRFIPCEAGSLIGEVTAIKHENGIIWVGTDIGMNQLVRPSMYGSYHEIEVVKHTQYDSPKAMVNFVGNVCESGDILGKERLVFIPKVGDAVIVHNAGAYGYSMASNYTGRPRPAEVMVKDDGTYKLIRKAEILN